MIRDTLRKIRFLSCIPLYYFFRLFPLQNKVVATTFRGRKYGDNSQYIIDELAKISPTTDIVWLQDARYKYSVPDYVRLVPFYNHWKKTYELATAKVWVNTHRMEKNIRKRKGQLFIETWHGGLGIKKIEGDVPRVLASPKNAAELKNTAKLADVFISNSNHLTQIYRRAFNFQKVIWKCGYPKNDKLFAEKVPIRQKVLEHFSLDSDTKLFLYAPTFRDNLEKNGTFDFSPYKIDFQKIHNALTQKWGGKWAILVRWHPIMLQKIGSVNEIYGDFVQDASRYPDMQELIIANDVMLSDYSSCIFDSAFLQQPCFIFATDFDDYKKDRGVYYELQDLPFPYAKNENELISNIINFNSESYSSNWKDFSRRTGLYESGHAAYDIAKVISEFIKGNKKPLESIQSEP